MLSGALRGNSKFITCHSPCRIQKISQVSRFFQAQKTPGNPFCRQKSRALVSQLAVKIGIIFLESALKHQHVAKGVKSRCSAPAPRKSLSRFSSLERVFSFKQIIIGQAFGISESSIHFASVFIHLENLDKKSWADVFTPGSQRK